MRAAVRIPIAVKLSPYFTSLAHFAARLDAAGVNGLVLFNRFLQPDISLEKMAAVAHHDALLARARRSCRSAGSRSCTGACGRSSPPRPACTTRRASLKQILAGAQVVQLASTLVKNGIPHLGKILAGHGGLARQARASARSTPRAARSRSAAVQDPGAFERAQYVHLILSQNI